MPEPVSVETWMALPKPTVRVPVRLPIAVGVKATLIWQLPPAGTGALQPLEVTPKSPVATTVLTVEGKMEVLLQVKVFEAEAKPTG